MLRLAVSACQAEAVTLDKYFERFKLSTQSLHVSFITHSMCTGSETAQEGQECRTHGIPEGERLDRMSDKNGPPSRILLLNKKWKQGLAADRIPLWT